MGTADGLGNRKRREVVLGMSEGSMSAGSGATGGFTVMAIVAAERSGFGGGVDVLFGLVGFRGF